MAVEEVYQKWSGKINEVIIGPEPNIVKIGKEEGLPFLFREGKIPNKPRIAFEIWDSAPSDWPDELAQHYKDVSGDPLSWAKKCVEQYKAELLCLRLQAAHPDFGNKTAADEAKINLFTPAFTAALRSSFVPRMFISHVVFGWVNE